jgi:hypothetical protein
MKINKLTLKFFTKKNFLITFLITFLSSFSFSQNINNENENIIDTTNIIKNVNCVIKIELDSIYESYTEKMGLSLKHFTEALSLIESNNSYLSRRSYVNSSGIRVYSQYWGKYQLGTSVRKTIGISHISWTTFKNNPELQDAAMNLLIARVKSKLENHIVKSGDTINIFKKYSGKVIAHHYITESGLIGMAHNCGIGGVTSFLASNGKIKPKDGMNTSALSYLSLANYNINITVEEAEENLKKILAELKK